MAKVHPAQASDPCSTMSSAGRETFTIWMKSLVCHTNGCTVFDSNGDIVYRVENYDSKGSSEVQLMDLRGRVLFTILKRVQIYIYIYICNCKSLQDLHLEQYS